MMHGTRCILTQSKRYCWKISLQKLIFPLLTLLHCKIMLIMTQKIKMCSESLSTFVKNGPFQTSQNQFLNPVSSCNVKRHQCCGIYALRCSFEHFFNILCWIHKPHKALLTFKNSLTSQLLCLLGWSWSLGRERPQLSHQLNALIPNYYVSKFETHLLHILKQNRCFCLSLKGLRDYVSACNTDFNMWLTVKGGVKPSPLGPPPSLNDGGGFLIQSRARMCV